jgi:hypothetical protein
VPTPPTPLVAPPVERITFDADGLEEVLVVFEAVDLVELVVELR